MHPFHLRIARRPAQPGQHGWPVVLLDDAAAGHAREVGLLRFSLDQVGQHVVPFQNLEVIAVRAGNLRDLLAPGLVALGDPTAGKDHRRADLEDLRKLMRLAAAIGLHLRVTCEVHLPLGQVVLDLPAGRNHRQGRGRIGSRDEDRALTVDAFLVEDAVRPIPRLQREQPGQGRGARSIGASFIFDQRRALSSVGWVYMKSPGSMSSDPRVKTFASTVPPSWADFMKLTTRQGSAGDSALRISSKYGNRLRL